MKLTTSRGVTVAMIFTATLVIASLCSIIIMQTNNATASNVIYKQKIRGDVAVADSPKEPTSNKQTSLAELHKLNITLSNYFDLAPTIINGTTISETPETKQATTNEFIVLSFYP